MNNFAAPTAVPAVSSTASADSVIQPDADTDLVHVFDFDFSINPSDMMVMDATIHLGDTVHWQWDSGFHSVTAVAGSLEQFNSGDQFQGASFDHTFTHAGTFVYYCNIHGFDNGDGTAGGMSGTITVLPASSQWIASAGGDWNADANWQGGTPNGVDAVAELGDVGSAQTVFTNAPITLGSLTIDSPQSYLLNGAGSLTMQVSSGAATLSVNQSHHTIGVPVVFASDTNVTVAAGASLAITGATTIQANHVVTKSGDLSLSAPLTVQDGAALVDDSGSLVLSGATALGVGAKIDLKTNAVTVDYHNQSDPAGTINIQLTTGFASGAWNGNGIMTSSAIANSTALGWKDDPASQSILIKYTLYGDANLDGVVNTSDFMLLTSHFGTANVWDNGDFNYDGVVNALDFNALAKNFGQSLPSAGSGLGTLVPEPAVLVGIAWLAIVRRRKSVKS